MKETHGNAKKGRMIDLESVLDINAGNVWELDEEYIAGLWEKERKEEDFSHSEEKVLNVIRIAFDVVHFNPDDERDASRFEIGWSKFNCCKPERGCVAIRRKVIARITDVTYENVKHISASLLLELIDKNFGGGWDSLSLALRDIIESGFDISTTQLPASRIHMPGGTLEKKKAQGYEVLEITKGTWVEAIFAKKKDPVSAIKCGPAVKEYDPEDEAPDYDEDESDITTDGPDGGKDDDNDDTFYSSFAAEAEVKNEDEEGFPLEDE